MGFEKAEDSSLQKHTTVGTTPSGGRQMKTILFWEHSRGGNAHCLVRVNVPRSPRKPVVIISELRSNPDDRGVIDDFANVAMTLLSVLKRQIGVEVIPEDITWIAHYGPFSYYDAFDPESFTGISLRWDGRRYHDDLSGHQLIDQRDLRKMLDDVELEPVPQVLAELNWRY